VAEEEIEETVVEEEQMEVEPIAASGDEYVDHDDRIVEETIEEGEVSDLAFGEGDDAEQTLADARPVSPPPPAAAAEEEDEFASDVAEADFYIQAGLPEDARAILEAITMASPDHPGATQRLRDLGAEPSRP